MKPSEEWGKFTSVPNVFIENAADLSLCARWLFVILLHHRNQKTKVAFPSYDRLRLMLSCSNQTLSKAIKELEAAGWIERRKQFGKSTIYRPKTADQFSISQRTDSLKNRDQFSISQNSTKQRVTRSISKPDVAPAETAAGATTTKTEIEGGGGGLRANSNQKADSQFVNELSRWIAKCCKGSKCTENSSLVRRTARALDRRYDGDFDAFRAEHERTLAYYYHNETQLTLKDLREHFKLD